MNCLNSLDSFSVHLKGLGHDWGDCCLHKLFDMEF